jgi:hypothetical protein
VETISCHGPTLRDPYDRANHLRPLLHDRPGGPVRTIKIQGVPGVDTIPMNGGMSNLQAGEIFKIRAGRIHEIETLGVSLPYGTKSGWE